MSLTEETITRGESSFINMFTAACGTFAQKINQKKKGTCTMHATPSLDEKDNVKMFQVVVPKRGSSRAGKSVFCLSEFQLTDLLVERESLDVKQTNTCLEEEYNCNLELKIKAEICHEIIDVVELDIKFGSVMKQELVAEDLNVKLCNRHINMAHPYVKKIQKDRSSLCLISGVVFLPDGGSIHRVTDEDGKAKGAPVRAKICPGDVPVWDRRIDLAKNTAVAYNIQKLYINEYTDIGVIKKVGTAGETELRDEEFFPAECFPNLFRTFDEEYKEEEETGEFKLENAHKVFFCLLTLDHDKRLKVNENLLELMKHPSDMVEFALLLKHVQKGFEVDFSVTDLAENVVSLRKVWQPVLEQAGFSVSDDSLVIPKSTERIAMFREFFEAATELEESLLKLVTLFSSSYAEKMLDLIRRCIYKKPFRFEEIYQLAEDETSRKMMTHLKFHINPPYSTHLKFHINPPYSPDYISAPEEVPYCMYALYWILFALYGK